MKVGDKVIVIENYHGHGFKIGEQVEILEFDERDGGYQCSNGEESWWLWRNEFKTPE